MYIHTRTHTRLQFRQIIFYNFVTARKLFAGANNLQTTCKQLANNLTACRPHKRGSATGARARVT